MTTTEIQQQIQHTIAAFPENKLKGLLDFVTFLAENDLPDEFYMQMNSTAYREWLSEENDIYDEVFKDEL